MGCFRGKGPSPLLSGIRGGTGQRKAQAYYVPSNVVKVWLRLETGVCTLEGTSELVQRGAKELDARDPRNRVHAELMSYGVGGQYVALVVGRFGEFSKDFIKLRDYIARQKAYAYVEHFNSSVIGATSMFKLSITSRWALMAARGWARLILDRRRDLINDRPSRAAAAEAPLDGAQERHHFDNPTNHSRGAFYHGEEA